MMIEAVDIWKRYRDKTVLSGACLTGKAGECIGVVGSNGCGKTTLFSILAGTINADKGSICYDGEEAAGKPGVFVRHVAYVPQEPPIMDELSVKDNLKLWYAGNKRQMEEDLEQGPAAMLGIGGFLSMTAGKLSGGMKKRLSIACALSNHAPVLIMDEPGAALDLICKEEIRNYLVEYMAGGGTVLLASHELAELSLCSQMYVLKQGALTKIATGLSAKELVDQFV